MKDLPMLASRAYAELPRLRPDAEIAQSVKLRPISQVAMQVDVGEEDLEQYGSYNTRISENVWKRVQNQPDGKLILVTAMTATPAGEGKTVTSIGLAQALGKLGKSHMLVLREPSLGPTFGIKGGAAGGGFAQI